jgi:transcriptional regulator with XRE-family HTH domain
MLNLRSNYGKVIMPKNVPPPSHNGRRKLASNKALTPAIQNRSDTPTEEMKDIGRRIATFRDNLSMSNSELAEAIGIGLDAVNKIVSGESCKKYADLGKIARLLKVTPNDILGFKGGSIATEVRAAIEASYAGFGLDADVAAKLADTVLSTLEEPQLASARMDRDTAVRVQAELAVRAFLSARKRGN